MEAVNNDQIIPYRVESATWILLMNYGNFWKKQLEEVGGGGGKGEEEEEQQQELLLSQKRHWAWPLLIWINSGGLQDLFWHMIGNSTNSMPLDRFPRHLPTRTLSIFVDLSACGSINFDWLLGSGWRPVGVASAPISPIPVNRWRGWSRPSLSRAPINNNNNNNNNK